MAGQLCLGCLSMLFLEPLYLKGIARVCGLTRQWSNTVQPSKIPLLVAVSMGRYSLERTEARASFG